MLQTIIQTTIDYFSKVPKTERKTIGQFFTDADVARYMANMFSATHSKCLSILDAGAGSGILSAAVVERLQNEGVERIILTCFENDSGILPVLRNNLDYLKEQSKIPLEYIIYTENFVTNKSEEMYDWVIGNPPYCKIKRNAPEALAIPDVCYGAVNLYALFAAKGISHLRASGQLVFLMPRSWTSGAYFQKFREHFLTMGALEDVHMFQSRGKVFGSQNILQETMIVRLTKSDERNSVKITTSESADDLSLSTRVIMPYQEVVYGPERFVCLPTNAEERKAISFVRQWNHTLPSIGIRVRTGLMVPFRCKEYLRESPEDGAVPLLSARCMQGGHTVFPSGTGVEYIKTTKESLLQPNQNFLLLKRLTTKEERRRLKCSMYLKNTLPEYAKISMQSHLNFVEGINQPLTSMQVHGLYVLFHSTVYDLYYRALDGSVAVNAREINRIPVPSLAEIEQFGRELMRGGDYSTVACDKILSYN